MKLIVHHSAFRMIESKIQEGGSEHGENYNSNCSYPTYKSIEHYIDQERAYKLAFNLRMNSLNQS